MTAVRDPAFWRRFSMAVHMDEETQVVRQQSTGSSSTTLEKTSRPKLEHTESWLDRNRKKRRKALVCGWVITLVLILLIAGIALACLWWFKVGPFSHHASDSPSQG